MSVLWTTSIRVTRHLCRVLTHWGRVTHICVSKLTIIGSDNGLSPDRRQAIIWTNAGILLIGPLETSFSEILIEIHAFAFKKMHLKNVVWKMAAMLARPQCVKILPHLTTTRVMPSHVCLLTYLTDTDTCTGRPWRSGVSLLQGQFADFSLHMPLSLFEQCLYRSFYSKWSRNILLM